MRSNSSQILRSASIGPPLREFFAFHSNFYRAVVLSSSGCCPSFPTFDFRHLNDPCQAAVESVFSVGGAAIVVPSTSSRQRCAWNWKYLQMLGLIGSQALSGHFWLNRMAMKGSLIRGIGVFGKQLANHQR